MKKQRKSGGEGEDANVNEAKTADFAENEQKMAENEQKMAENEQKMAQNEQKLPDFGQNEQKMADFAQKEQELMQDLQRTRADFENFRKQTEVQRQAAEKAAKRSTVYKLLPVIDNMGRAIESYPELAPLKKSLEKALKDLSLTEVEAAPGTEFNPEVHEAMMVEGEGDKEVVSEVLQPGYLYEGEILRPAMVKVRYE